MRYQHTLFCLLLLLAPSVASAQKRKAVKKPVVETPQENPRIAEMLEATQQVTFIDSIVVDKASFLEVYQLNAEAGTLHAYNDFFKTYDYPYNVVYMNELGNKCYFAREGSMYTSDLLGAEWSEPLELGGVDDFNRLNYPFMMPDGTTFYFAAMGDQSLGGLDIYRTRFDAASGQFLKPENIGMPFNSEANDYMYAIDELDSIGYFATDRRQPEDKVCIYMFIPSETRHTYDIDELGEQAVRSLARIDRISDTWGSGTARGLALERLARLRARAMDAPSEPQQGQDICFVINDQTTYTRLADFRSTDNRLRFQEWQQLCRQLHDMSLDLQKMRNYYAGADAQEQQQLKSEILTSERLCEKLEQETHQLEKTIRNEENKFLNPY